MVPGSTLIYGSSFTIAIFRPRASRMAPSEAAAMPFPNEETTPPVVNTYLVMKRPAAWMMSTGRQVNKTATTTEPSQESADKNSVAAAPDQARTPRGFVIYHDRRVDPAVAGSD